MLTAAVNAHVNKKAISRLKIFSECIISNGNCPARKRRCICWPGSFSSQRGRRFGLFINENTARCKQQGDAYDRRHTDQCFHRDCICYKVKRNTKIDHYAKRG